MRSSLERTIEKGLLLGIGSNLLTTESIRICSSKPYLIRHRIYENEYLVHNNLALHVLMTQTTTVAAPKRVRAGRLCEKLNCGCFSLFKLPAVLRRSQNESRLAARSGAIGNGCDFKTMIVVDGCDL